MTQGKADDGELDEIDKALRLIQFHIDTGDNKPVHWRSTMTTGLLEAHQAIEALLERRELKTLEWVLTLPDISLVEHLEDNRSWRDLVKDRIAELSQLRNPGGGKGSE